VRVTMAVLCWQCLLNRRSRQAQALSLRKCRTTRAG
jgi:hypothetical protein